MFKIVPNDPNETDDPAQFTLLPCPVYTWASSNRDAPAILTKEGLVSYGNLDVWAENWHYRLDQLAKSLEWAGIGDIAIAASPTATYLAAFLGALRANESVFPLNPKLPVFTRNSIVNRFYKIVLLANPKPAMNTPWRYIQGKESLLVDLAAMDAETKTGVRVYTDTWRAYDEFGEVNVLTSGSSGIPKIAVLGTLSLWESARRANTNIPVGQGDRWLLSLPLFHVSGLGVLFRCWLGGAAVALPAKGQPLLEAIETLRPTHVSLVATQLRRLLANEKARELLRGMKAIVLGGSAIPEGLLHEAYAAGLPIHKSYGLTEMCSQVATTRPGADLDELLTSGFPLAVDTVRISRVGEIQVRGETLFRGYHHAEELSPTDWFATGDLGCFDEKGRLIVLGRKDNMYISGGENIHPEEVERVLAGLPGVELVMVVAVPDEEYGQVGFAFVAMAAGAAFDVEALRAGARAALPGFKVPKHFHPWPEDLVETGIKPSRAALSERALEFLNPAE